MKYHSNIKKTEILHFAIWWMKPETIMLNQISHSPKQVVNVFPNMQ